MRLGAQQGRSRIKQDCPALQMRNSGSLGIQTRMSKYYGLPTWETANLGSVP